ncbi:hypothetical protein SMIM3I_00677 [Streptococcus mitis]|uniref:Uncharacterized protein n=1 Tax=Streptococcus mitis TaxID=28037 RepID=A0A150NJX3_STRMT|nr:hypothetical protein SMIM3I_00677 [Streptococcus mitis]
MKNLDYKLQLDLLRNPKKDHFISSKKKVTFLILQKKIKRKDYNFAWKYAKL